jgi:hypothetical protein
MPMMSSSLFKPYYQGNNTLSTTNGGLNGLLFGAGLANATPENNPLDSADFTPESNTDIATALMETVDVTSDQTGDEIGDANTPASSVNGWLGTWLNARTPQDFIPLANLTANLSKNQASFPQLSSLATGTKLATPVALPNQPALKTRAIGSGVTLTADSDQKLNRVETLLKRINTKLGRPLLENVKVVVDNTLGDIGSFTGTGMQAVYQNTRYAGSGQIFEESLHINSQFIDYLARQPIGKAEAYLAAVLFHEQSHREVMQAAAKKQQFHDVSQADERNANERAEAAIAQHYPQYYSWLGQHYFDLFRTHFTQAYGALPLPTDEDWQVIHEGNKQYNLKYFPA